MEPIFGEDSTEETVLEENKKPNIFQGILILVVGLILVLALITLIVCLRKAIWNILP